MFEEHKYEALKKLGLELHIPIVEAFLRLEVFDKDGNLVQGHSQRSHSWVRNAYNMLFSQMAAKDASDSTFGAGKLSITDTSGVVKYSTRRITVAKDGVTCDTPTGSTQGYLAPSSDDDRGILIGTGTNAESFEDYALQTKIADGTSAGQMSYIESESHAITYTAGTKVLKDDQIRYFNNNSGGSIGVNEVAMCALGRISADSYWLVSRDKLGATITVADTGQLKVTYTIQITYPA